MFASKIIGAINSCEVFLFMYSKAHKEIIDYENDWTIRELNFAQEKKKRIVFINIDGSELTDWFKLLFGTKQQVDGKSQDAISHLTTDMRKWLDIDKPVVSSREPHIESSKHAFSFKTISKNKGCSIALTVAFVLCIVALPLGYLSFERNGDTPLIAGSTSSNQTNENSSNSPNPNFTGRLDGYEDEVTTAPPIDKIEFVDLGLPSGTLWAEKNLGAETPNAYGNYYSWGEIKQKSSFYEHTYTKPNILNVAGTQHDVASTLIGGNAKLPSHTHFNELIKECKWEWTENNSVSGYSIIGKNGNRIFLPAAGRYLSSVLEYKDQYGYYWAAEVYPGKSSKCAYGLSFGRGYIKVVDGYLYSGRTIRAIKTNE